MTVCHFGVVLIALQAVFMGVIFWMIRRESLTTHPWADDTEPTRDAPRWPDEDHEP